MLKQAGIETQLFSPALFSCASGLKSNILAIPIAVNMVYMTLTCKFINCTKGVIS